jgi:hypothetical protein
MNNQVRTGRRGGGRSAAQRGGYRTGYGGGDAPPEQDAVRSAPRRSTGPPGFPANWESELSKTGKVLVTINDGVSSLYFISPAEPGEGQGVTQGNFIFPAGTVTAAVWLRSRTQVKQAKELVQKKTSIRHRLEAIGFNGVLTALEDAANMAQVESFVNGLSEENRRAVRMKADQFRQYLRRGQDEDGQIAAAGQVPAGERNA